MTQTTERPAAEVVVRPSAYATLLVHAEPATYSTHRVQVAARLARDLDATLLGLGAETFDPIPTPDPFTGYAAGEWVALVQAQIGKDLQAAEAAFHRDAAGAKVEWRSLQEYPHRALVRTAHAADLIVASPRSSLGVTRAADPADVVMSAGRPVLMVPAGLTHLHAMTVVVAWKDTRECRRALADALPFLQRADNVIVHAICARDETDTLKLETDDVAANLKRHGVDARALVTHADPEAVVAELTRVAQLNGADLIVTGAYGHSRLHEWAFGGVTDAFMRDPPCFVLMSH
ncbi:MAG: universal stress protein [Caulobacterales bacterium]|nr:universal stress protein [Caulobacterales bacterium]